MSTTTKLIAAESRDSKNLWLNINSLDYPTVCFDYIYDFDRLIA